MTDASLPSNVIRFPVEMVRLDTDTLFGIAPVFYAFETMRLQRDGDETCTVDDIFQNAEREILPVVEALDRSDPEVYRDALKKIIADAVAEAMPSCRAFKPVEMEYLVRMQRHEKDPDNGFFGRMVDDYQPTYEAHLEAAYHAYQRVLGITRVLSFAREGQPWEPSGQCDSEWLVATHLVAAGR